MSGKRSQLARERLEVVDGLLRNCLSHSAITAILAKQWDVTRRQVRNYIRKAYDVWDEDARLVAGDTSVRAARINLRRAQLEGILETAMSASPPNLSAAVQAMDRLCKVEGAYAPIELGINVNDPTEERIANMTSNDKRKRLAEIEEIIARRKRANGGNNDGRLMPH